MNQAHNPQSYSFVQPAANRVNLTYKPTTADSRHSPSPYKLQRREPGQQHPEPARSPVRRHFSTISPLKEMSTNIPYRVYSSKIEGVTTPSSNNNPVGQTTNTINMIVHPPQAQQQEVIKKPEPSVPTEPKPIIETTAPPRSSSKIIEERKNAIDQIISNCTQLNFGHSSRQQDCENARPAEPKPLIKMQNIPKTAIKPEEESQFAANDLKKVRTHDSKLTPRGNVIDHALNREIELRKFTSQVVSLKDQLTKQLGNIDREREQLMASSQQQRNAITKNYQQLYSLLKQYEQKDINCVLYWQEECLCKLKDFHEEFAEACTRLELMNQDITPNIAMIKTQIDEQQYKTFMTDYRKQIQEISMRLANYHSAVASVRPELNQKDLSKLAYDIVSVIEYPQGFNKSALCFSFEGKNLPKKPIIGGSKILVEDYSEPHGAPQQIRPAQDSQQPFRALFHAPESDDAQARVSPTFKKL